MLGFIEASFLSVSLCVTTGSESECIGHFKLLFSLLRVHGAGRVQQLVLEVRDQQVSVLAFALLHIPAF